MVYNVGDYILKKSMGDDKEKIKNITGMPVAKPTFKIVFSLMKAIYLVTIVFESEIKYIVTNITDNHEKNVPHKINL